MLVEQNLKLEVKLLSGISQADILRLLDDTVKIGIVRSVDIQDKDGNPVQWAQIEQEETANLEKNPFYIGAQIEKERQEAEKKRNDDQAERESKELISQVTERFKEFFKDRLDDLERAGVIWQVKMQDKRYSHMGFYVEFRLKNAPKPKDKRMPKSLKMEICATGYRYEFVDYNRKLEGDHGMMQFGKWDTTTRFDQFIYEGLFK